METPHAERPEAVWELQNTGLPVGFALIASGVKFFL
jgi:hypothetical protein